MTEIKLEEYLLNPHVVHEPATVQVIHKEGSYFVFAKDASGTAMFIRCNFDMHAEGRVPKTSEEQIDIVDCNGNRLKVLLIETWSPDDLYDQLIQMADRHLNNRMDIRDNDGYCMLMRTRFYSDIEVDAKLAFTNTKRTDDVMLAIQSLMAMAYGRVDISHNKRRFDLLFNPIYSNSMGDVPGFGVHLMPVFAAMSEIGLYRKLQEAGFRLIASMYSPKEYGTEYRRGLRFRDVEPVEEEPC